MATLRSRHQATMLLVWLNISHNIILGRRTSDKVGRRSMKGRRKDNHSDGDLLHARLSADMQTGLRSGLIAGQYVHWLTHWSLTFGAWSRTTMPRHTWSSSQCLPTLSRCLATSTQSPSRHYLYTCIKNNSGEFDLLCAKTL